jgi:hypothetical protein
MNRTKPTLPRRLSAKARPTETVTTTGAPAWPAWKRASTTTRDAMPPRRAATGSLPPFKSPRRAPPGRREKLDTFPPHLFTRNAALLPSATTPTLTGRHPS